MLSIYLLLGIIKNKQHASLQVFSNVDFIWRYLLRILYTETVTISHEEIFKNKKMLNIPKPI